MESHHEHDHRHHHHNKNLSTNHSIGFCLLPSELIQNILLCLALPEITRLKSLNSSIAHIISDQAFVRQYNLQTKSHTWLFLYKKRWHRDSILEGITDHSNSNWFRFQISTLLKPIISRPGESLYFLAASGNFFLFASNTLQELVAVNLVTKSLKKIPPSPLGPRGTTSWRRSGMKLVTDSGSVYFRFLFVELLQGQPFVFVYHSKTDMWSSILAEDGNWEIPSPIRKAPGDQVIFLYLTTGPHETAVVAVGSKLDDEDNTRGPIPVVMRPRFMNPTMMSRRGVRVGLNWGSVIDRLYVVYGDGYKLIVESSMELISGGRRVNNIELWGMAGAGGGGDWPRHWIYYSKVPTQIMEEISVKQPKPYEVMMGCLDGREGRIKVVLMSNYKGIWSIIWLSYDLETRCWAFITLPDCNMKGLNLAGIAFSHGLALS